MKKRTTMDSVRYLIKVINRYLESLDQRITLSEEKSNHDGEIYWDLTWYRSIDQYTEAEEHVFGGDEWELFAVLTGIEYGIRMQKHT